MFCSVWQLLSGRYWCQILVNDVAGPTVVARPYYMLYAIPAPTSWFSKHFDIHIHTCNNCGSCHELPAHSELHILIQRTPRHGRDDPGLILVDILASVQS